MKHHLKKATTETKHSLHSLDQTSSCPDHYITHYPTYLKLSFPLSTANFLSSVAYPSFFTAPLRFLRDGGDGNSIQQKGKAREFEKSGYCVKCLQLQDIVLNACSCRNVLTNNNYHSILTSLAFLTALKKLTPFNAMFPPIWKPSHLKL